MSSTNAPVSPVLLPISNRFLTELCTICGATGKRMDNKHWLNGEDCPYCRGRGYTPNEMAKDLIECIKLYVR